MYLRRTVLALLAGVTLVSVTACNPSGVADVTIDAGDVTLVMGEQRDLTVTVDASGDASDDVTWSSGDASVVTVTDQGEVAAVAEGVTEVTATSVAEPAVSDTVAVEVLGPGAVRWTRRVGTEAYDEAKAIAVAGENDVLVAGPSSGQMGGSEPEGVDIYVRKLDTDGDELWTHQFGSVEEDDVSRDGLAVDGSDAVIVGGQAGGDVAGHLGNGDALVRKLDADGQEVWTRQFGTAEVDEVVGVAVDASDAVVAAGETFGALAGANFGKDDAFVRKLAPDGTTLWTRQFGTANFESVSGVAVDPAGNVLVAGHTNGDLEGSNAGHYDVWVRKLDADGQELWTRQFGTGTSDYGGGVAVDAQGNVLVSGATDGVLGADAQGDRDAFVRKLDADGQQLWTRQFGTGAFESAAEVAADGSGNAVVVGVTRGGLEGDHAGADDVFVRKLDADGQEVWTRQFGTASEDDARSVAVDGLDRIVLAGFSRGDLVGPVAGGSDGFVRAYAP